MPTLIMYVYLWPLWGENSLQIHCDLDFPVPSKGLETGTPLHLHLLGIKFVLSFPFGDDLGQSSLRNKLVRLGLGGLGVSGGKYMESRNPSHTITMNKHWVLFAYPYSQPPSTSSTFSSLSLPLTQGKRQEERVLSVATNGKNQGEEPKLVICSWQDICIQGK
jgi:hypothetical protein